jgi:hypothetical protein
MWSTIIWDVTARSMAEVLVVSEEDAVSIYRLK